MGAMYLYYGQIAVISSNSSDNVCYRYSSFALYAKDNSASSSQLNYSTEDSYVHYCYVMNNFASYGWICINFWYKKHTCESSNIINNSQKSTSYGIITNAYDSPYPTTIINKCCLIKNNLYGSGLYLFYVDTSGSTMEVRDCTIQNGYSIYGAVTTSYSNTVAGSECAVITNCGANINKFDKYKSENVLNKYYNKYNNIKLNL
jgi:hypothetical protein